MIRADAACYRRVLRIDLSMIPRQMYNTIVIYSRPF